MPEKTHALGAVIYPHSRFETASGAIKKYATFGTPVTHLRWATREYLARSLCRNMNNRACQQEHPLNVVCTISSLFREDEPLRQLSTSMMVCLQEVWV